VKPQHFAIFEFHISKGSFRKFHQTQVTGQKLAFCEFYVRKIGIRKIAVFEGAHFIFAGWQWGSGEILFVESFICNVNLFHSGYFIRFVFQ
jgi:hypothetical protein